MVGQARVLGALADNPERLEVPHEAVSTTLSDRRSNYASLAGDGAGNRTCRCHRRSAAYHGHDPYAYLMDVLTRLPTQRASEIEQLLPH
ncbi:hypothetical protein D3C87_1471250 [compost metagenome]